MTLAALGLRFAITAVIIVAAGTLLARGGDVIAARTTLGGVWVGSVFLALATSLPEISTDVAPGARHLARRRPPARVRPRGREPVRQQHDEHGGVRPARPPARRGPVLGAVSPVHGVADHRITHRTFVFDTSGVERGHDRHAF